MTDTTNTKNISRRNLLKSGAAAVAGAALGSSAITGFPTIWAQNPITLRQFGTGVSNLNAIAEKCKEDLGITLEMTATDSDAAAQRAVTQPDSYDIADIEYWILKKVFPTGVIQPMDTSRLTYYDKIVPLFKTGKLLPDSVIAQGTAPHTVGFVEAQDSKTFAGGETGWFTMVPTIYNADTLGIRPDLVGRDITTWADIMDPAFKGKTAIINVPSIGIMDAAGFHQVVRPTSDYRTQFRMGMYRFHVMDPIRFESDLKITVQALGWGYNGRWLPIQDDVASVAYWYQTLPAPTLQPLPDREFLLIV